VAFEAGDHEAFHDLNPPVAETEVVPGVKVESDKDRLDGAASPMLMLLLDVTGVDPL
jgi:hypothetical protein